MKRQPPIRIEPPLLSRAQRIGNRISHGLIWATGIALVLFITLQVLT